MDMQQFVKQRIKKLKLKLHAKQQSNSSMAWIDQQILSSEITALNKLQKEFNKHQKSFG